MLSFLILSLALLSDSTAVAPSGCSTVTKAKVEAAIGHSFGEETAEHSSSACTREFFSGGIAVTISIHHLTEPLDLAAELESLKRSFPDSELWEVEGLAGRAFALDIPGAGTQLHVLPGGQDYLMVSVLGLSDGDHGYSAAMTIARQVLANSNEEADSQSAADYQSAPQKN